MVNLCGIIGYIGSQNASEILVKGLRHLEYRGYDSVGVATAAGEGIELRKDRGMIGEVAEQLDFASMNGPLGIGHTRWATHGAPCRENAHPHFDCNKKVVLVHNGVLEN